MKAASETRVVPCSIKVLSPAGTCCKTRGLISQPKVLAIIQLVPFARSFMVAPVPVGFASIEPLISLRNAQVLLQPLVGSCGLESPSMYGNPIRNVRPGPELAGSAYRNLCGLA